MHFNEGAWRDDQHRLRRYSIRLDGFVSLHAPLSGGELITKPLTFTGTRLFINYATSAAGSVRIELQDAAGEPLKGLSLVDSEEMYGDSLEQRVSWKDGSDLASLVGQPIRLRISLRDADIYSFRFANSSAD